MPVAPAAKTDFESVEGAYWRSPDSSLLVNIVLAKDMRTEPKKVWQNMRKAIATAIREEGRLF